MAKATASSRLEGNDRCEVVQEELKRLFGSAPLSDKKEPKARPEVRGGQGSVQASASSKPSRPPRPPPLTDVVEASRKVKSERFQLSKPPPAVPSTLILSQEERRKAMAESQRRRSGTKTWSQEEENRELRQQLRKLTSNEVSRPHFESAAAENHWLRREVTSKLLQAWLSAEGTSSASTRAPTPANSTPGSAGSSHPEAKQIRSQVSSETGSVAC
ncbi:unnamed protein product [Symbiodinium natans]|uniref:Uncharacterized protein n=1 Tax=Symbiodinium natans TaxID=878477 RepID=A0A812TIZ5_9DINO|nr:unnamed protein product [Symbiodinium natans]